MALPLGELARERLRGRVRLTRAAPHPALRATVPRWVKVSAMTVRFWLKRKVSGCARSPRGAVAQRLRGYKSAEPEKTVKRSSRRTGVNLQFFPVQPTPLGLKGASSPFFVAPARRNRWWFSGSLLPPKENISRQAEPSPRSAFKIVQLPEISRRLPALRRCCFAPAAPAR